MTYGYEINELRKEESWRMFRIIGEMVGGFDKLADIEPAVSIYGSARLKRNEPMYALTEDIAYRLGQIGFSIVTGGGPGVMEAANKGAQRAGVKSVGLKIQLSEEQAYNTFTTRVLTFDYFFVRKVMLVKYATAFVIMPGGLGTLDELTEILTLIQTRKIKPFPIVMVDSKFWSGFLEWLRSMVMAKNYISSEDFDLLRVCETAEEVVEAIQAWHIRHEVVGERALR